jgi:hypothetical protein
MRLAIAVLLALAAGCSETRDTSYETLARAVSDGAVERGWVPAWLPASARDIHLTYDLDTNESMLSVRYRQEDAWAPPSECSSVDRNTVPPAPFSRRWWPRDVPPSKVATHRHVFLYCAADKLYLAVLPNAGEAYVWR